MVDHVLLTRVAGVQGRNEVQLRSSDTNRASQIFQSTPRRQPFLAKLVSSSFKIYENTCKYATPLHTLKVNHFLLNKQTQFVQTFYLKIHHYISSLPCLFLQKNMLSSTILLYLSCIQKRAQQFCQCCPKFPSSECSLPGASENCAYVKAKSLLLHQHMSLLCMSCQSVLCVYS